MQFNFKVTINDYDDDDYDKITTKNPLEMASLKRFPKPEF